MSWMHYLPFPYLQAVSGMPSHLRLRITEVRFRLEKPFSVTAEGRNLFPDREGRLTTLQNALRVTRPHMEELLARLTEGSLYAFEDCMANGYIPLENGCRAGIAGDMTVTENGAVFREITSVNLRISRFLPEFARPLTDLLREGEPQGVLVLSPPAGGKTTFLRSAAHLLSTGSKPCRVGIADERNELFLPAGLCDRITGCPKWKAIELLTRTMSPEYLVCDELGAGEEAPLLAAQNTGVKLIASAHGSSPEEAAKRPCVKALLEGGVFSLTVVLKKNFRVEIYPAEEVSSWS